MDDIDQSAAAHIGQRVEVHRAGHLYSQVTFDTPSFRAAVDTEGLGAHVRVHGTQEELEFTTDGPLLVETMAVSAADLRIHRTAGTEAGEVKRVTRALVQILHTAAEHEIEHRLG